MSLSVVEAREPKFLARFENVWSSLRRFQVRQGLCLSFLVTALCLLGLVVADYRLELSWPTRAAALAMACALGLVVFLVRVVGPLRWWTKPRTAVEIEGRFPQLGQRIRTVVQFAGLDDTQIDSAGVTPGLVGALELETETRVRPLPLDDIVPWKRVWISAAVAAIPALVLLAGLVANTEWRVAFRRVLLGNQPYTTVVVKPGNLKVDQGESVPITVELRGRLRRNVVLYTIPKGQTGAAWKATALKAPDRRSASIRETKLEKVNDPIVYRVVAGPASSETYTVDVRYPLAFKTFDVSLQPPAYTGVKPSTVKGGNLQVIVGTTARFQFAFDTKPSEVAMIAIDPNVRPANKNDKTSPAPEVLALKDEGSLYSTEMTLTKGLVYRIEARTSDGRLLPKNRYKIDVREDRPPQIHFDEPAEALEVHPIAEVMNRVRAADDFGLSKVGIAFRFNNGEEQTLAMKDFAAGSPEKNKTSAALQEWLLLEKLAATPTDSLAYYAFAEDNYPSGSRRTETDLRYIDIRPFKREYKAGQDGDPQDLPEDEIATLNELIARQRFNLNRAIRMAKHKPTDKTFAEDPLKIANFEENLANLTRETTEGLEGVVGQRVEPLHQAEESMLGSIDAIDRGNNAKAPHDMEDALRHLIEARNTIQIIIGDNPQLAKALRRFDRTQAQKIRKPKKEGDDPEAIAEEIEELAQKEDFVYATLAALGMSGDTAEKPEKGEKEGDAKEGEKSEPKEAEKGDAPANGQEPGNGSDGPKREGTGKPSADGKGGEHSKDVGAGNEPQKAKGQGPTKEETDESDSGSGPPKDRRREAVENQEKIAAEARALEEKLKKIEAASDLARERMKKAAESTEQVSGALARGNTKEATETAKHGAWQLHELARQVKGEITSEVTQELAMARDLANELAERENELAEMSNPQTGDGQGTPGQGDKGGTGSTPPTKPGRSRGGLDNLTDTERLERLEATARTLEEWLKGASQRAEGKTAEAVRDMLEASDATKVVERTERIGALFVGGEKPEAGKEAKELAEKLEVLAKQLDVLHQEIVAPRLAQLVEYDRRVAEMIEQLKTLKTEAEITEWHRMATDLVRDMEKAGLADGAAALAKLLADGGWHGGGGNWRWALGANHYYVAPELYTKGLQVVVTKLQDKIQDLILKDLVSDRNEATPPEFKELVERYYEVLSKDGGGK